MIFRVPPYLSATAAVVVAVGWVVEGAVVVGFDVVTEVVEDDVVVVVVAVVVLPPQPARNETLRSKTNSTMMAFLILFTLLLPISLFSDFDS